MLASPLLHPRVGLIVPKYNRSAVARNRLKRQLREIVRTQVLELLPQVDVVIRARASAYAAGFDVLANELRWASVELGRVT